MTKIGSLLILTLLGSAAAFSATPQSYLCHREGLDVEFHYASQVENAQLVVRFENQEVMAITPMVLGEWAQKSIVGQKFFPNGSVETYSLEFRHKHQEYNRVTENIPAAFQVLGRGDPKTYKLLCKVTSWS